MSKSWLVVLAIRELILGNCAEKEIRTLNVLAVTVDSKHGEDGVPKQWMAPASPINMSHDSETSSTVTQKGQFFQLPFPIRPGIPKSSTFSAHLFSLSVPRR